MDILGKYDGPAGVLSNITPHAFLVDRVPCASMEGFLQSLKIPDQALQGKVCLMPWREAQEIGRQQNWQKNQTLFWQGRPLHRQSLAFQELLDRAYRALARTREFQEALLATGEVMFEHTVGKRDPAKTVLTVEEFISRLLWIRADLRRPVDKRTFLDF